MDLFYSQGSFPQSRKFPQSRTFSTRKSYLIKEMFYKQESFPQSMKFSRKKFTKSRTNTFNLDQENFLQTKKFPTSKNVFLDQGSFSETKIFTQSKNISANKDQSSLKVKILDPFNTKFYPKVFLTL